MGLGAHFSAKHFVRIHLKSLFFLAACGGRCPAPPPGPAPDPAGTPSRTLAGALSPRPPNSHFASGAVNRELHRYIDRKCRAYSVDERRYHQPLSTSRQNVTCVCVAGLCVWCQPCRCRCEAGEDPLYSSGHNVCVRLWARSRKSTRKCRGSVKGCSTLPAPHTDSGIIRAIGAFIRLVTK